MRYSFPSLFPILQADTIRHSSITFLGTAVNALLGAGFYILAARVLGPADFGLLAVSIAVLTLTADIGNLGTNAGLVRFVSKYLDKREKAHRFVKFALETKLLLGAAVVAIGWFLAPFLADIVFEKPRLLLPLRLGFLGSAALILFSFSTSFFQALQRFWSWSAILVGTNSIRLTIIILLWWYGNLNLETTLLAYITTPFLGFIASLFFVPRNFLGVRNEFSAAKEFFHYNKWIALFILLTTVSGKIDTFLVAKLLPSAQLGFYAAATQIVFVVPHIITALETVINPKMAEIKKRGEALSYLKKTFFFVLGLAFLGLLTIPIVIFLIPLLYGSAYAADVPVIFVILFLGMLIFLVSAPIQSAVLYHFGYPKLYSWVAAGQLAIIGLLGWYLVVNYGVLGAAVAVLIGHIFNFAIPAIWLLIKTK